MPRRVTLQPIPLDEKAALAAMMRPYLDDHARTVDPEGRYGPMGEYPHFDLYWLEPERRPYWIEADGARAGFVLVNRYSPSGRGCDAAISEFYVEPPHRRRGVGRAAALAALATAGGVWELQVFRLTEPAMAFWPRVIEAAGPDDWEQIGQPDRVIHRFRLA
jgi:predicted acetyltransferase